MQLSLFDSVFELGDRVRCSGGDGTVYFVNDFVWVCIGNVARPYEPCEVSHVR